MEPTWVFFRWLFIISRSDLPDMEKRRILLFLQMCYVGNLDLSGIGAALGVYGLNYPKGENTKKTLYASFVYRLLEEGMIRSIAKDNTDTGEAKVYRLQKAGLTYLLDRLQTLTDLSESPAAYELTFSTEYFVDQYERMREGKNEHTARVNEITLRLGRIFCIYDAIGAMPESGKYSFYNKGKKKKAELISDVLLTGANWPINDDKTFLAVEVDLGNMNRQRLYEKLRRYREEYGSAITVLFLLKQVETNHAVCKEKKLRITKTDIGQLLKLLPAILHLYSIPLKTAQELAVALESDQLKKISQSKKLSLLLKELMRAYGGFELSEMTKMAQSYVKEWEKKEEAGRREKEKLQCSRLETCFSEQLEEYHKPFDNSYCGEPGIVILPYYEAVERTKIQPSFPSICLAYPDVLKERIRSLGFWDQQRGEKLWYCAAWGLEGLNKTGLTIRNVCYIEGKNILISMENVSHDLLGRKRLLSFIEKRKNFPGVIFLALYDELSLFEEPLVKDYVEDKRRRHGNIERIGWELYTQGEVAFVSAMAFFYGKEIDLTADAGSLTYPLLQRRKIEATYLEEQLLSNLRKIGSERVFRECT